MQHSPPTPRSTRDLLVDAALELFERDGFDSTPVSRVAASAGVTEMTFFRYFGSKAAVVVEDPFDPLLAQAVAAEPAQSPPLLRVVAGVRRAWSTHGAEIDQRTRSRVRIIARSPALRAESWRATAGTQEAVARVLAVDGVDAASARVAAAACFAALHVALLDWAEQEPSSGLGECLLAALDVLAAGSER